MSLLRLGLPLAVLAFFVYKSRAKPIYLTLLPWIVGLGRALFIDLLPNSVVTSVLSFQISVQDLLFGLVAMAWAYSCVRRRSSGHFLTASGLWISGLWFVFLIVEGIVTATDLSIQLHPRALLDLRSWFYFPLSTLLLIDTYRRYDREEMLEALGALSYLAAGVTVLYILDSGFGLKIYPYAKLYQDLSAGVLITRDFTTFSIFWLGLVISYLLAMPRSPFVALLLLAIMFTGVFFSYTRSLMILIALIIVLTGALLFAKSLLGIAARKNRSSQGENPLDSGDEARATGAISSQRSVFLVLFVILPLTAGLLMKVLSVLLPTQWGVLVGRFSEMRTMGSQGIFASQNMALRWSYFTSAWRDGSAFNPWLGNGLILHSSASSWMSYDSDWIHLVFRFGIVGLVVFMVPLIWAPWAALSAFLARRDRTAERLALIILLFNVFAFFQRFTGIVYLWWYPLSTLGIALAALEADQLWQKSERSVSIKWA